MPGPTGGRGERSMAAPHMLCRCRPLLPRTPHVSSLCDRDEYTEVCSKLYEELKEHVRKVTNSSSQGKGYYANIDKGDEQDHDNYSNFDPDKTDDEEEEDQMDIRLHVAESNQSQATSPNALRPRRKCRTTTPMNYNEDAYDVDFAKQCERTPRCA